MLLLRFKDVGWDDEPALPGKSAAPAAARTMTREQAVAGALTTACSHARHQRIPASAIAGSSCQSSSSDTFDPCDLTSAPLRRSRPITYSRGVQSGSAL